MMDGTQGQESDRRPAVPFTMHGLWHGARAATPLVLSAAAFGLVFGVVARQAGLSLIESVLMSALVFAGTSQLVALQLWVMPLPIVAVILATFAVNARHLLFGAALRPWFRGLPLVKAYGSLFFMTDGNWALALREHAAGRRDAAILLGSGIPVHLAWTGSTALGFVLGGLVGDPARWGLDIILPVFCVAMLAGLWKGRSDAVPWLTAAAAAVLASAFVPGYWHVLIGGFAGSIVGALRHA